MRVFKRHAALWQFLIVLALALILRLIVIGTRSIQYDDAFSIFLSERSLAEIIRGTAADTMPPLYYFLLHFWLQLGRSLTWLRLLSVLLSLGSVTVLYLLVRRLFGHSAGIWAALLAAIAPLQLYHAQDLRMYALLALSQLSYYYFFIRIWRPSERGARWTDWLGLVLCGAAAMYSHNLAVFGLAIPNLILLFRREWKPLLRLLIAQAAIGLLALPWLWLVPGQVAKIQRAFWTPRPGLIEVMQAVLLFVIHLPLPGVWMMIGGVIAAQAYVLTLLETWRARREGWGLALLIGVMLGLPILLFITSYLIRPVFVTRGFLVASLAFYALAGRAVAKGWRRGIGPFLLSLFVIGSVISLPAYYSFESFPRSPFQAAATALQSQLQPGDVILHDNKLSYFPFHYYAPNLPQVFLADEPGSSNDTYALASQEAMQLFPQPDVTTAIATAPRIHFVVFTQAIRDYQSMGISTHPVLTELNACCSLVTHQTFGDLEIYTFDR